MPEHGTIAEGASRVSRLQELLRDYPDDNEFRIVNALGAVYLGLWPDDFSPPLRQLEVRLALKRLGRPVRCQHNDAEISKAFSLEGGMSNDRGIAAKADEWCRRYNLPGPSTGGAQFSTHHAPTASPPGPAQIYDAVMSIGSKPAAHYDAQADAFWRRVHGLASYDRDPQVHAHDVYMSFQPGVDGMSGLSEERADQLANQFCKDHHVGPEESATGEVRMSEGDKGALMDLCRRAGKLRNRDEALTRLYHHAMALAHGPDADTMPRGFVEQFERALQQAGR
jgi:hypothetical protein